MTDPRLMRANDMIDAAATAVRQSVACLRAIEGRACEKDAAHLLDLALEALEKGEKALDEHAKLSAGLS